MKVLVTGATGFIGSHVSGALADRGYEVAALTRTSTRRNAALDRLRRYAVLYEGDLRDYFGLRFVLRDFLPDVILHFGAITSVGYSFRHAKEVTDVNYGGTIHLLEAARAEAPSLVLFGMASSMEVYGKQDIREPFKENLSPEPLSPYGIAKLASEKFLQFYAEAYGFPCVVLRQTNVFGRTEDLYFVVEAFVSAMLLNEKEVNFGRPTPYRNFLYIDDLVDLWAKIVEMEGVGMHGEVFNTGPDNALSIGGLADLIAKKLDWHGKVNWGTRELRPGEVYYLNSSPAKIKARIGWEPKISLSEGLDLTIGKVRRFLDGR